MVTGSIVALVTPMKANGELDWEAMNKLLDMHVEAGTSAVVGVGTTGESSTLSVDLHCKVIKHIVDYINGRIVVIAGTGANSTLEAIELTKAAKTAGANACLSVTPYYNKPTQQGLYLHHKAIAEAVDLPHMLYNVPGRTAVDMLPDTVEKLSKVTNIIGIKEATGDLQRGAELMDRCGDKMAVYSGDDNTAVELMLMGGQGNISVTANIMPKMMSDMCAAALQGRADEARTLNEQMAELHQQLFLESNPIPVKWALHEMGLIDRGIRLPLTPLSEEHHDALRATLTKAGLL